MSQSNSNYTLSSSPTSSGMRDEAASRPRTSTCGIVILPNGKSIFVKDKEAYFAQNPTARAATEASIRDFNAWAERNERKHEHEARVKAEKRAKKDREMEEAGLHGCVGGEMAVTCRECAGNGRAYGVASFEKCEGKCDECDGKGFILSPCDTCDEKKASDKKEGTWNKPRGGPACVQD